MLSIYKSYKKVFLAFFVLTFLLYGNSLRNKYAIDDDYITVTNFPEAGKAFVPNNELAAKGFKGIGQIWKSRYAHDSESSFEYRPVTSSSFAIEYGIFGQSPFMSHLINVLLYAITCCVLFCVLFKLFEAFENKASIALLASFLFLILPVHTEAVDNIKCRDELFAFLFPLISMWYCLKACEKVTFKNLLLIVLFFLLGFFSKRSALIFIGIIPLSLLFFRKVTYKTVLTGMGLLLTMGLTDILIQTAVVKEKGIRIFYHFENPMYTEPFSLGEKLMAAIKTLGFYVKFCLIPYPFRNYYGTNVVDISPGIDLHMLIALLFLATMIWLCYKTRNRIFIFGLLLFLGGIFPFSNLFEPVAGVIGERLVYNASMGLALMAGMLLIPAFKGVDLFTLKNLLKKPVLWLMPVVVVYTLIIWNRNAQWKDKVTLFEADIPHLDMSAKANSMLGNEYFEMLRLPVAKYPIPVLVEKALKHYTRAIKNDSTFYSAYNNAGVLYFSYVHDFPKAEQYFTLALKVRPVYPQAYENIGNLYKHLKRNEEAIKAYITCISQNPKQYNAYMSLIKMQYEAGRYRQAIAVNHIASVYFPKDYSLIGQEADCLFMLGQREKALEKYEEAYQVSPSKELAGYLAQKYFELGNKEKASLYKNK